MQKHFILILIIVLSFSACKQQDQKGTEAIPKTSKLNYKKLEGKTMGTTWHITYAENQKINHQSVIDSILLRINQEVSTYIDSAIISQFNQSEKGVAVNVEHHAHFLRNYKMALEVYQQTHGQFDPTVMPLVNFWGFGYTGREKVKDVDESEIEKLLDYVGMTHTQLTDESFLSKDKPETQLDFSALAKGYAVDQLCRYFDQQGVEHYFVEIGGEVNTRGKNSRGNYWSVGISRPEREAPPEDFYLIIQLDNKAIATSGNYRNVYTVDGKHYFHTIDPVSGYPKGDRLLSASVVTENCMEADAYATALMVMGLDKAITFTEEQPELGVCLIYSNDKGELDLYYSKGMESFVNRVE